MIKVKFVDHSGTTHDVRGEAGQTLMQIGRDNLVPGIVAECGGWCSCATCMVYVDQEWEKTLPPAQIEETAMIGGSLVAQDNSRLSCQITLTDAMDGLTVNVPAKQF